jgi:hypothetical protein
VCVGREGCRSGDFGNMYSCKKNGNIRHVETILGMGGRDKGE